MATIDITFYKNNDLNVKKKHKLYYKSVDDNTKQNPI